MLLISIEKIELRWYRHFIMKPDQ